MKLIFAYKVSLIVQLLPSIAVALLNSDETKSFFYPLRFDSENQRAYASFKHEAEICMGHNSLNFGNSKFSHIGISSTGVLSLIHEQMSVSNMSDIWSYKFPRIVPLWCAAEEYSNRIYVYKSFDTALRIRALQEIQWSVPVSFEQLSPHYHYHLYVITWCSARDCLTREDGKINAFQVVLLLNYDYLEKEKSFVMFNYGQLTHFNSTYFNPRILPAKGQCLSGFYYDPKRTASEDVKDSETAKGFFNLVNVNSLSNCRRTFRVDDRRIIEGKQLCNYPSTTDESFTESPYESITESTATTDESFPDLAYKPDPLLITNKPIISKTLFYPFRDRSQNYYSYVSFDEEAEILIDQDRSFLFGNSTFSHIGISSIGVISLINRYLSGTDAWSYKFPRIVPLWCDNEEYNNRIYFYESNDYNNYIRVNEDIQSSFPELHLQPYSNQRLIIITWLNSTSNLRNAFQVVLLEEQYLNKLYIMFNYGQLTHFHSTKTAPRILPAKGQCMSGFYYNPNRNASKNVEDGEVADGFFNLIRVNYTRSNCRRTFRVDGTIFEGKELCEIPPAFESPKLEGPVVIDRRWIEFYCVVPTTETSQDAVYNVTFLFDSYPDPNIPTIQIRPPLLKATLHEKHLRSKHLGKSISCRVTSFWRNSTNVFKSHVVRIGNSYRLDYEVASFDSHGNLIRLDSYQERRSIYLDEGHQYPITLTIRSTIPITCGLNISDVCHLPLRINVSSDDILVRTHSNSNEKCLRGLDESDWKQGEKRAYKTGGEIQLFTKTDPHFFANYKYSFMTIDMDPLPDKTTSDGERYPNIWNNFRYETTIYRYDRPYGVCRSTGHSHVTTFDRRVYTIYPSGQFTYIRTTYGIPVEVQVRHKPCGPRVSCVCGVAMREGDVILAAHMCGPDSRLHYIKRSRALKGAEIRRIVGNRYFEIVLPGKVKVLAHVYYWGLNLQIQVTSSEYNRVEGLCGTFDGKRWYHEVNFRPGAFASSVDKIVERWRVPMGRSLFDGIKSTLLDDSISGNWTFCACTPENRPCKNSRSEEIPSLKKIYKIAEVYEENDVSGFNYTDPLPSPDPNDHSWPTRNKINETEAIKHCRRLLWEDLSFKDTCKDFINQTDVNAIIDKCILDIKLTDDLSWANDKVPEVQSLCVFDTITTDLSMNNRGGLTIEDIKRLSEEMLALICVPFDCAGQGKCENGTCICNNGFNCVLSEDLVPHIVRVDPQSCDLEKFSCQTLELLAENVTDLSILKCKIEVKKFDNSTQVFFTNGYVRTAGLSSCELPTDNFIKELRLLKNERNSTTGPEQEMEFTSLPPGNPVLRYTVSVSYNHVYYSNALPFFVYDSRCFTWNKQNFSQRERTCLIRGYCFKELKPNPLDPECEICDPSKSNDSWTKILCEKNCEAFQSFNKKKKTCFDSAPPFGVPVFDGPVLKDNRSVEFYCFVPTNVTNKNAIFNVTFLVEGQPDANLASIELQTPNFKATLPGKNLTKKHLEKKISCRVSSYWQNSEGRVKSRPVSSHNSYWVGIQVSPRTISVYEGAQHPVLVTLKSTIPITCGSKTGDKCEINLRIKSDDDDLVLVRKKRHGTCRHILKTRDWKREEKRAYSVGEELEVFANIDLFVSAPRRSDLTIEIGDIFDDEAPKRKSIWSRYRLPVTVYHHDGPHGVCRSTGDPHVTTFDGSWYTIYPSGQFTYIQTTHGIPIEVQVRHQPCGQSVSCVCGVAMREGDVILVADMCGSDSRVHFITYNDDLRGAEIRSSSGGRAFEIVLPSKVKAQFYVNPWGMNLEIQVTPSEYRRIEGLCGSFDGNIWNDLTIKGKRTIAKSVFEAVKSWEVPSGESLFDGIKTKFKNMTATEDWRLCSCALDDSSKCDGPKMFTNSLSRYKSLSPKRRKARNTVERRKRSTNDNSTDTFTDDIDYEYDSSSFNYTVPLVFTDPSNDSWPTGNKMNETEANDYCRRVLWDDLPIRTLCKNFVNQTDVDAIINKCVSDIKLTDDQSWANDKIPEVQNLCVFEAITTNITQANATNSTHDSQSNATPTIEDIMKEIQEMTSLICLPQNCSGNGICKNGTCICKKGFIGTDCALSEDAAPTIHYKIGPESCDLEKLPCKKIEMLTKDVAETSMLSCKVEVQKYDTTTETKFMSGSADTMQTTSCPLPTDDFIGKLRLLKNQTSEQDDEIEFTSLPTGNPVLHYTVSISNNRIHFSNALSFVLYDSMCFNWNKETSYSRKPNTCLINGYCFANLQRNPLNPECEMCDAAVSSDTWTKISRSAMFCASCSSSPCPEGTVCRPRSRGRYTCIEPHPMAEWTGVIVISVVSLIAVGLTVAVVFFIIRR